MKQKGQINPMSPIKLISLIIPIRLIGLISLISLISLMGCNSSQKQTSNRVTTDSAPYELLLIADKDWLKTAEGYLDVFEYQLIN